MTAMFAIALLVFGAVWFAVHAMAGVAQGGGAAARLAGGPGNGILQVIAEDILHRMGAAGMRWRSSRLRAHVASLILRSGTGGSCTPESLALVSVSIAFVMSVICFICVPLLSLPASALGLFLPLVWLLGRRKNLVTEVTLQLPFTIELLAIAVDAGMDFMAAVQRVAEKARYGVLRSELQLMLHAIRLGSPRGEALLQMSERLDVASLRTVVSAVVQADKLGVPVSNVLRDQADFLRFERFQRAEQAGAVASQKILLPVALLILPAFLLLTLGSVLLGVAMGGNNMFFGSGM